MAWIWRQPAEAEIRHVFGDTPITEVSIGAAPPDILVKLSGSDQMNHCSELKKDWNDNLAAIFEAKLKAAMKAKPPKYDLFSKALFDPLTSCFRAS